MASDSNIQPIVENYFRYLDRLLKTFNFTRRGKEHALGVEAAHKVGQGIIDRTIHNQTDANGNAFPVNSPKYDAMKIAKYSTDRIGVRTGQMLTLISVLGKIELEPFLVTMRYGTNTPPPPAPNAIYPKDTHVTDTKKAEHFTDKKGDWYQPDENIADKVREHFADALSDFIDECNSRS